MVSPDPDIKASASHPDPAGRCPDFHGPLPVCTGKNKVVLYIIRGSGILFGLSILRESDILLGLSILLESDILFGLSIFRRTGIFFEPGLIRITIRAFPGCFTSLTSQKNSLPERDLVAF